LEATLNQSFTPLDSLLFTIVLATLAVGLPILLILSTRFLLDRKLSLGRSKELEKLIWQLHRIASAMEHQMNLSFPAVQPGTEEPRDLAYLQHLSQPAAATAGVATPRVAAPAPVATPATNQAPVPQPAARQPAAQQPVTPAPPAQEESLPPLERRDPSVQAPRAGVNSMFDL
jgi:hypothetical protein